MKLYSYALTLFHNILKQATPQINEASQTSQHQLSETNVNNYLGKTQEQRTTDTHHVSTSGLNTIEPIVRLWILRLLIPLGCHHQFIRKSDFYNDEIAKLFALAGSDEACDDDVDLALKHALGIMT